MRGPIPGDTPMPLFALLRYILNTDALRALIERRAS
jgi:hypothetical protein